MIKSKFWSGKKVLVTGSEGMIGKELVEQLLKLGVRNITHYDKAFDSTLNVFDRDKIRNIFDFHKPEYVFHLFGIKGNPKLCKEKPLNFMIPMLRGDLNIIEACQQHKVKRMLYTSSIAVDFPESDWFPAWAKRTGEELIKAMRIQYPKGTKYTIVRPANVYGRYDNFDNPNAMVITSLIKAASKGNLILDKRGCCQIRDFINAKDVARGMIKAMKEMPEEPVNLCSGKGESIDYVTKLICSILRRKITYKDLNLTLGPDKKVMKYPYIKPEISIEEGIAEVIDYVNSN